MPIRVKYPTFEGHFFIFSWGNRMKNFMHEKVDEHKNEKNYAFLSQNRPTFLIRNKNVPNKNK